MDYFMYIASYEYSFIHFQKKKNMFNLETQLDNRKKSFLANQTNLSFIFLNNAITSIGFVQNKDMS